MRLHIRERFGRAGSHARHAATPSDATAAAELRRSARAENHRITCLGGRRRTARHLRGCLVRRSLSAMMTHAGYTIASGLLGTYLGDDAGRRVHAGAVERGSVESIRAVLWYADMRS